jgi:hypothetical protein
MQKTGKQYGKKRISSRKIAACPRKCASILKQRKAAPKNGTAEKLLN